MRQQQHICIHGDVRFLTLVVLLVTGSHGGEMRTFVETGVTVRD